MNLESELILASVAFLFWLDIIIVLQTLANKAKLGLAAERRDSDLAEFARLFESGASLNKKRLKRLFDDYLFLKQSINLPAEERQKVLTIARGGKLETTLSRKMRYQSRYERMEAALGLALIGSDHARITLERALVVERDFPVKLFIANALSEIGDKRSIGVLVESLVGAHRWYRDKVNMLIASFGPTTFDLLRGFFWREDSEIIEMFIDIASEHINEGLEQYLLALLSGGQEKLAEIAESIQGCPVRCCVYCAYGRIRAEGKNRLCKYKGSVAPNFHCGRYRLLVTAKNPVDNHHRLMIKAAECMAKYYGNDLNVPEFLGHSDPTIRAIAIRSLGDGNSEAHIAKLLSYLQSDMTRFSAKMGLSKILAAHPRLIPSVVEAFDATSDKLVQQGLAEVLAGRIEYFITRLLSKERKSAETLIREVIALGKFSEIVEFLKLNHDPELEDAVIAIIAQEAKGNESLREECGLYLPDRILEKCGLEKIVPVPKRREEKRDWKMIRALYLILGFAVLSPIMLYVARYHSMIADIPPLVQLKTYVVDFNYDFAWYSISVNIVYIVLLLLSVAKVRSSTRLWNLKTTSFLFKPRVLPSVSIIAPAFNEEKTIIESATSLLNLRYPDYELVIVNDGSRDGTLNTLIARFQLKRVDYHYAHRLKTASVRGIYRNPLYPQLVVVDKENGGKADSLNAGLNISSKEYYCGIDADSLLEPDALLKVASLTLDYGVETPAMGGNVFPINGCTVDRGKLMRIGLPTNVLARLQTIEYLRAFMCGRMGWAQVNSLLIISGAFGLFRRERVISIGGYLTSNERYGKNTVGEDMELVVRIARLMREQRQKYRISYAYNANCWTEVPESLDILKRQRDRWHRGLIDIMFFHRKLLFNPSYGRMGLIGMPYFLIFELIGPLFEIQGYLMVALAAILGLMSTKLAIMLFMSTILMGITISMASVLIAERQTLYFSVRDTLKLLSMAFVENFGPRQVFSLWRVLGFFSAMKKPKGWGKMERKGFSGTATPSTAGKTVDSRKEGA